MWGICPAYPIPARDGFRRKGQTGAAVTLLERLLAGPPGNESRHQAGYELAQALDTLGDYPAAFRMLMRTKRKILTSIYPAEATDYLGSAKGGLARPHARN